MSKHYAGTGEALQIHSTVPTAAVDIYLRRLLSSTLSGSRCWFTNLECGTNLELEDYMKIVIVALVMSSFVSTISIASERPKISELGDEWIGLTRQSDPFDASKVEMVLIVKGDFFFRLDWKPASARLTP